MGYPTLVKGRLGLDNPGKYRFINRGIGGNRIVDLYACIQLDFISLKPDYISILDGISDIWHGRYWNHGYSSEFDGTPWVYCMLNNFGGRPGLHGHLDNMVNGIPKVLNECSHFCGIGMTCEASENNPVLYDFLFESVWQSRAEDTAVPVNIESWIEKYAERRYGRKSDSASCALKILLDTVYKAEKICLDRALRNVLLMQDRGLV